MHDFDALINRYIDHTIDNEGFDALCDWLRQDPAHRQTFARKLAMHSAIADWCIESSSGNLAGNLQTPQDEAELPPIHLASPDRLTKQQYFGALSYVLRHTFTPTRLIKVGLAAALLLGAVLAINLMIGPDTPDLANTTPNKPPAQSTPHKSTVATLTAEHNAVWQSPQAEGALAPVSPGSPLHPGQRLTLTAGFAEITTNDGAIAIIEAPATIELIDNDNALRLHSGKLVGICETESSKGFLVRTPHMDITDLGTRFGVDASDKQATSVHVLDGLVEVTQRSRTTGQLVTERVDVGQAVTSSARGISSEAFQADRFASAMKMIGQTIPVPGEVVWYDHPLRELRESMTLQVYTEQQGVTLTADLEVDVDRDLAWPRGRHLKTVAIPAGTKVDAYLLYLDTPGDDEHLGSYTVRFDRPILGVIAETSKLAGTDDLFIPAGPSLRGGSGRGALEDAFEQATVSDDGRTLQLTLRVAETTDQLRVLVAAEKD